MTHDDKQHDYLWDPAEAGVPEVTALEQRLAPLRFDPARTPLDQRLLVRATSPRRTRWRRPLPMFAAAAAILIASAVFLWNWRLTWPQARPWTIHTAARDLPLGVGQTMTIPATGQAVANIARIGSMRIGSGTSLELRATAGRRHRLRLSEGDLHVRVWAPPLSIVIETPAGEVIDLGCEFQLSVRNGVSTVRVLSGWVQLENGLDEMLVPAGASTEMSTAHGPGVPVFDDATPGFREAIRRVEADGSPAALSHALGLARHRDVYTLLQLADRHRALAESVLQRAADLAPPPDGITIASILRGNRYNLWTWANAQKLPSPKSSWWKNWRDALPFWLSER